jgi:DNA uptake protein ComE-like DNA-binding protein|tara:strand:+ start:187 stop:627 length:441 start_codon:yes stop_codon:yes gene_type:complete
MLYKYKLTGGLVEKVSQHDKGIFMCVDANEEVMYIEESMLEPHIEGTVEKTRNEERFTEDLKASGVNPAKPSPKETFPIDKRVNLNNASARQIADSLPGVGLKTARDIKDLQTTLSGERFTRLDQLHAIKRVDWEEIFKADLVRVD